MFRDCKIDSLIDAMSCSVEVEMNERDLEAGKKNFVIEIVGSGNVQDSKQSRRQMEGILSIRSMRACDH